jgi:hypothetical protein
LRDPTFRALACAAALIALWFAFGPIPEVQPPRQTALRLGWKHCADVVLLGDSTVVWRLQPEAIEDELPGYRVANFGFRATGFTDEAYLAAGVDVLDPTTPHRTVVIAASSSNIRPDDVDYDGFALERRGLKKMLANARQPSLDLDWHDQLDLRLRARGLCFFLWKACPWSAERLLGYNGELTSTQYPHDETLLIPSVENQNAAPPPLYDQALLDKTLLHAITDMRAHGIDVVSYVERDRPGIAESNIAVGFDRARLEQQLRDAGATVIGVPEDLTTMNGVHLDPASALRWSRTIGKELAARLPAHTASSERCPWPLQSKDR